MTFKDTKERRPTSNNSGNLAGSWVAYFAIVTFWPLVFRGEGIRIWACIIAGIFGVLGTWCSPVG